MEENRVKYEGTRIWVDGKELTEIEKCRISIPILEHHYRSLIEDNLRDEAVGWEIELTDEELEEAVDDLYEYFLDHDTDLNAFEYGRKIEEIIEERQYDEE